MSGQGLPHIGYKKGVISTPQPYVDRVNKSISNNIRLTNKCNTLLETSDQGLLI